MKHKRSLSVFSGMIAVLLLAAAVSVGSRQEASVSAAEEEPLYMFNVIGDMQMGDPGCYSEENYRTALEEIKSVSPETKAILTVGDHTNNGTEAEYETLSTIKSEVLPDVPMYYAIGNHDRGYVPGTAENNTPVSEWMDRFIQYARLSSGNDSINNVYYSFQLEGSYVIILGSEVTSRNDHCNDVLFPKHNTIGSRSRWPQQRRRICRSLSLFTSRSLIRFPDRWTDRAGKGIRMILITIRTTDMQI